MIELWKDRVITSMAELLDVVSGAYQTQTAYSFYDESNQREPWTTISFAELNQRSRQIAVRLQRAGVKRGDRIALVSEYRIEWIVMFYATILAGASLVPLDLKLKKEELKALILHCEPQLIFFSEEFRELARQVRVLLDRPAKAFDLLGFFEKPDEETPLDSTESMALEDTAVICYTSGTWSAQKGVEVSLQTLLFQGLALSAVSPAYDRYEVMFTILPLNHLYGLCGGPVYSLFAGIELVFTKELTPKAMQQCLSDRKVTQVLCVPLYLQTLMNRLRYYILDMKGPRGLQIFDLLLRVALFLPFSWRRFLFKSVHQRFGDHLRQFISGGSALDAKTQQFFSGLGWPVYVGYGLTETGPVISINTPRFHAHRSVGKPLPGIEVRVEPSSGEIFTRGPHVMKGYLNNIALTSEVKDTEGWIATGDLGFISSRGFLFISGRKKSLIVLPSGKKVHPEEVEGVLTQSPWIENTCVLGLPLFSDSRLEVVTAVIYPVPDLWLESSEKLKGLIWSEVKKNTQGLADYKVPQQVILRKTPFTLTTSQKIKRDLIRKELEGPFDESQFLLLNRSEIF